MATFTTQQVALAGAATTYAAANVGGDRFTPGADTVLHIKNTGASITVTVVTTATVIGQAVGDVAVVVPATTGERHIGPFQRQYFAATDGLADITYSATPTGVSVAVLRI